MWLLFQVFLNVTSTCYDLWVGARSYIQTCSRRHLPGFLIEWRGRRLLLDTTTVLDADDKGFRLSAQLNHQRLSLHHTLCTFYVFFRTFLLVLLSANMIVKCAHQDEWCGCAKLGIYRKQFIQLYHAFRSSVSAKKLVKITNCQASLSHDL